jgi:hypothetical protein
MIINNFDIVRAPIIPMKAHTPLIVDSYTVLTRSSAFECLKTIAGWNSQIIELVGDFQLPKFSLGDFHESFDTMSF